MEDQTSRDGAIIPSESNKQLSLSKEIIHRGLDLATKIDDQNQLAHYQYPIRYFSGILTPSYITFSRNGNIAAITSHRSSNEENNEIIIWDSTTGSVSILSGLEHGLRNLGYRGNGQIWSLALSSKGDFALAGYDDGDTLCWDIQKNQIHFRIVGHMFSEPVFKLDFSPDDQWIIRDTDYVINLYDADTGDYLRGPYIIAGNPVGRLNTMVFMHDGNKLDICGFYHPGRQFEGIQGKETTKSLYE